MARTFGVVVVLLVMMGLSAVITYAGASVYYGQVLDKTVQYYLSELERARSEAGGVAPVVEKSAEASGLSISCPDCHGRVEGFHNVRDITKLDSLRNRTPKVCTTCHGVSIHRIHEARLDKGLLDCTDCHSFSEAGGVTIPSVRPGDLLVCEQCHFDGNYIEIHVVKGSGSCGSCHVGSVGRIHQPTMANVEELLRGVGE
jgi:hypothetical protein